MSVFSKCFAAVAVAALALPVCAAPQGGEIALTYDDMPSHNVAPAGVSRAEIVQKAVTALKAAKAPPVYGFVNARALQTEAGTADAMKIWRNGGNLFGNHTFSHPDADKITSEAFIAEVKQDEAALATYGAGTDWHWMRLPFLRGGDTPEKRAALNTYLQQNGYRIADVTVGFNDWDYNPPYARCLAKGDQAGVAWLKAHYLAAASAALDHGQKTAQIVFGRDIKHVFLLHIGAFDAEMLPDLLGLLQQKHFRLIGLPEAESDPVYAQYGFVREAWGGGLQQRAAFVNHVALPAGPADNGAELQALCR